MLGSSGSSYQWFSGSCGGTFLGTGNSITVQPTATTTYFVREIDDCSPSGTGCASITINYSADGSAPSISNAGVTLTISPNNGCNGAGFFPASSVSDNCSATGNINQLPSSGLVTWLRADAGVYKDASGNVLKWNDLSGSGNNFQQSSAGARPTQVAGAINGNSVIHFNTAQFLVGTNNITGNYSVFTITRMTGATNRRLISSNNFNWLMGYWGGFQGTFYNGNWISPSGAPLVTPVANQVHMYVTTQGTTAPTAKIYDYGNVLYTGSDNGQYPGVMQLNSYSNGLSESSDGDVAEIIVYNRKFLMVNVSK